GVRDSVTEGDFEVAQNFGRAQDNLRVVNLQNGSVAGQAHDRATHLETLAAVANHSGLLDVSFCFGCSHGCASTLRRQWDHGFGKVDDCSLKHTSTRITDEG